MMRSIVLLLVIATGVLAKTKTATIRYKQGTMGIETIEGEKGWQIKFIHPVEPGQPNLNVGDMITGIAGISFLGMSDEEQQDIFDEYIEDGVEMDVEPVQDRYASKNGGKRYTAGRWFCGYPHCLKDGWREFMHINGATCCENPTPPTNHKRRYGFRARLKVYQPELFSGLQYASRDKTCRNTTGPEGVHDFEGTVSRWWEHRDGEQRTNYKPSHPENWHRGPWAMLTRHYYEPCRELKQGAKKPRRRGPTFDVPPENCCNNPEEREDGLCKNNWIYKTVPDSDTRIRWRYALTSEGSTIRVHHKFRKGRPSLYDELHETPWYSKFWGKLTGNEL